VGVIAVPPELAVVVHFSMRYEIPEMEVRDAPRPVGKTPLSHIVRVAPTARKKQSLAVLGVAFVVWVAPGTSE
jgi:hypothetical protein